MLRNSETGVEDPSASLLPRGALVPLLGTKTAAPAAAFERPLAVALPGVGLPTAAKPEEAEPAFLIAGRGEVAVLGVALVVIEPSGRMIGIAAEERGALGAAGGRRAGEPRAAGLKVLW
jgi:hypothetical protein